MTPFSPLRWALLPFSVVPLPYTSTSCAGFGALVPRVSVSPGSAVSSRITARSRDSLVPSTSTAATFDTVSPSAGVALPSASLLVLSGCQISPVFLNCACPKCSTQ